jgi:hypothetical protein
VSVVLLFTVTLAPIAPIAPHDEFPVRAELQGLYDEISQVTQQLETASDVDLFHSLLYTSDWVFIDATGQRHSWWQVRQEAVSTLELSRVDSMTQSIQTLSLVPNGATVLVNVMNVRTMVDYDGRYGRKGGFHTLTEATVFRDGWIRVADDWKLRSREQIGQPTVLVDRPPSEW